MIMRTLRENVKWIMLAVVIIFCLSIFGMYGFGSRGSKRNNNGNARRDYAVAEIDGKKVMRSALEQSVRSYVERAGIKDITSADMPQLYQGTLDRMVIQTALAREAKELGVAASDAEIEARIKDIENQFPTKEAFQQYIEQNGIDMKALRKSIGEQLAQIKLIQESTAGVSATDKEIEDFYEKGKDLFFHQPEGFDVKLARFKTEKAAEDMRQLLGQNMDWKKAIEIVSSEDLIQVTSGDTVAFIPLSAFTGKLEPAKDLSLDKVSGVMEVASGDFLLLMKTAKVEDNIKPFSEVSADVKQMVEGQKRQKAQNEYINEIKTKTQIKILDESLFPKDQAKTESGDIIGKSAPEAVSPDISND